MVSEPPAVPESTIVVSSKYYNGKTLFSKTYY